MSSINYNSYSIISLFKRFALWKWSFCHFMAVCRNTLHTASCSSLSVELKRVPQMETYSIRSILQLTVCHLDNNSKVWVTDFNLKFSLVVNFLSSSTRVCSQQASQQVKGHSVRSTTHRPAARSEKGSWEQEGSPESEAVRPTALNPPRLSPHTSVCRSLLSPFAPETLSGPLWRPWLWQRSHPARTPSPCTRPDSESHTRGRPSACGPQGGPWCPSVAQSHRPGSLYMTPHSYEGFQNGPGWDRSRLPTPASTPPSYRGGWRRAGALQEHVVEVLTSEPRASKAPSRRVDCRAH